jgi:OmpA-OmpF porin, OOP family
MLAGRTIWIQMLLIWCVFAIAQSNSPNLIPNPGFELIEFTPKDWFNLGGDFSKCMKYWSSPTGGSPDVYAPGIKIPHSWSAKGFGEIIPRTGEAMVGITIYGCDGYGKPHCREYIQVQLNEPLVLGQKYHVEMWVRHLENSLESNNLGFHFSKRPVNIISDPILKLNPQVNAEYIITCDEYWEKISGEFVALTEAEYMIIGNFYSDDDTHTRQKSQDNFGYAYYYIDDVVLRKLPPLVPVAIKDDDIRKADLVPGNIIPLKYIFFETDKSELLPRSFLELNYLAEILQKNPQFKIEVRGHTDNLGEEKYNVKLSRERARAVVNYLVSKNISSKRLRYKGYGSSEPLSTNLTEAGRSQNRRVEILVIEE